MVSATRWDEGSPLEIHFIVENICTLLQSFEDNDINHVYREATAVTDFNVDWIDRAVVHRDILIPCI